MEPEIININKLLFVRRPTLLLDLIGIGKVPFESVIISSSGRFNDNLNRFRWAWTGTWNYEAFSIGKKGGISLRMERNGKVKEGYAGSYFILLRDPFFKFKYATSLGNGKTVGEVRQMFKTLEDIFDTLQEPAWPYAANDEFGITFSNQEDAVTFSAMLAANQIAA